MDGQSTGNRVVELSRLACYIKEMGVPDEVVDTLTGRTSIFFDMLDSGDGQDKVRDLLWQEIAELAEDLAVAMCCLLVNGDVDHFAAVYVGGQKIIPFYAVTKEREVIDIDPEDYEMAVD